MDITIGKHKGKSVAEVILKNPDYVLWVLQNSNAEGSLKLIQNDSKGSSR